MGQRLKNNELCLPKPKRLPGQNMCTPHCLVGDEAFSLSPFLMKPFPHRQAKQRARLQKYNYRLSRAYGVVENTFGILVQKWRLYQRPLEISVKSIKTVVMATCVVHNYLREKKSDERYFQFLDNPEEDTSAFEQLIRVPKRATRFAMQVRERFVDYFSENAI